VTVEIAAHAPLKTVFSPSHPVTVARVGDRNATVAYADEDVLPDRDLSLYYSVSEEDLAVDLLTYRDAPDDGFFLLLLSPGAGMDPAEAQPKDVLFVLDTSGSMRGQKIEQAQDAAEYVLENLNPEDRFSVIAFASTVDTYADGLRPASERAEAQQFIRRLTAGGGTNIHAALTTALGQVGSGRPQVVVFLTDGLPTEGEVRSEAILAAVRDLATEDLRLFAFGVGYDVNTILLDTVSQEQHGVSTYVQPGEDIEAAVSAFYDKISLPVLTDVTLDYGSMEISEVYPFPLPDVFSGGQLLVVGRYRQGGEATITLSGSRDEGLERFIYGDMAFAENGGPDLIPRLWATRKIGHLLTQIRLHGPDGELIDEIIDLSVRYGIVTPYPSFLVDETEDALSAEGRRDLGTQLFADQAAAPPGAGDRGMGGGGQPVAGKEAVEASVAQEALRSADTASGAESERVRPVGSRSFVLHEDVWVDTTYDQTTMTPERVPLGSARYFDLLAEHPEWGRYLALGPRVLLVWEGQAYEITPAEGPTAEPAPRRREWNWG
ncbi:MAG: VWA domain-containing protein, partial [Chloroflexi bacterium]|nr:VWA domain-containing protein [Chloroflexota bacterium]